MGKRMLGQLAHLHNVVGSLKLISTTILESKMYRYAREGGGGVRGEGEGERGVCTRLCQCVCESPCVPTKRLAKSLRIFGSPVYR